MGYRKRPYHHGREIQALRRTRLYRTGFQKAAQSKYYKTMQQGELVRLRCFEVPSGGSSE
jgi:hypothetical protein